MAVRGLMSFEMRNHNPSRALPSGAVMITDNCMGHLALGVWCMVMVSASCVHSPFQHNAKWDGAIPLAIYVLVYNYYTLHRFFFFTWDLFYFLIIHCDLLSLNCGDEWDDYHLCHHWLSSSTSPVSGRPQPALPTGCVSAGNVALAAFCTSHRCDVQVLLSPTHSPLPYLLATSLKNILAKKVDLPCQCMTILWTTKNWSL